MDFISIDKLTQKAEPSWDEKMPVSASEYITIGQIKAAAKGDAPEHEWDNTKVRFKNPDGTWGTWIELKGDTGNGIVSVLKTSTNGLIDTYTITYDNLTTKEFSVANGRGVVSFAETSAVGLEHTYTITYNDDTADTFTVTDGEKGDTGDNIQLRAILGWVEWKAVSEETWHKLVEIEELRGRDGENVVLDRNGDYLRWRWQSSMEWNNLLPLSDIKGDKGDKGEDGKDARNITQIQADGDNLEVTFDDSTTLTVTDALKDVNEAAEAANTAAENAETWLETADATLAGKQDKLDIDPIQGDNNKFLNELGDFEHINHAQLENQNANPDYVHISQAEKDSLAFQDDIEALTEAQEELFKVVNIGSGGLVTLKPTTKNFTYKLTVLDNTIINIDLSKMISQVGSARARFIVDIPIASTITWMKPIVWGGAIPTMTAGQYIFEVIDVDGSNAPLIWLVSSTTKTGYSGVTLFVDSTGADYSTAQINGETATRTTSSWANPFKYVQNAILAAQAGDVVFVKQGTHYPTHKQNTNTYTDGDRLDRLAGFTMKAGVDVWSGFRGDETYLWQRDFDENGRAVVNETIYNGDLQRDGNPDNFSYNVWTANVNQYTYLGDAIVKNGNANSGSGATNSGGGIYSNNANLVKLNCIADSCSASYGGGGWSDGTNYNCIAESCSASSNGGGWYSGTNYNCIAESCSASYGGGWYSGTNYNCIADSCSARYSGGGWYSGTNYNCIAESCSASYGGGGWSYGTNYNCIAESCSASDSGGGWRDGTNYNCIAVANTITSGNEAGAGWRNGTNYNCISLNNECSGWGAAFRGGSNIGCTLVNNKHLSANGIANLVAVRNCVFINNSATNLFQDNSVAGVFRNNAYDVTHPTNADTETCIQNLTLAQAGITVPSFVGLPANETQRAELKKYVKNIRTHLKPLKTSVLKGAGINNVTYPNPTDFEGTPRPENCTIGAFEAHED